MGGAKGSGAFPKGSEDAMLLTNMFLTKKLNVTAQPDDVVGLFPSLSEKTQQQIRTGFNKIRKQARETLVALELTNDDGKYFLFIYFLSMC
jgi:hypothetical protein